MAPDTAASGPAWFPTPQDALRHHVSGAVERGEAESIVAVEHAGDYEVTLTIPDFDTAAGPDDAVRMFIASVQENPDAWCYQVTDDKTGRKWLVDRQGDTREVTDGT